MTAIMTRTFSGPVFRFSVSVGLLVLLWFHADGKGVLDQFQHLEVLYVLAALAITVPQVALSAWRWHLTTAQLELHLPFRQAFSEYYLATFLNQVLPGGVVGDAARAWRHGRSGVASIGAAARAVVLERASGQIALFAVVLAAAVFERDAFLALFSAIGAWGAGILVVIGLVILVVRKSRWQTHLGVFLSDCRRVFSGRSGALQLVTSLGVVATYLAVYGFAARAVGVELSTGTLMTVVPIILFSMVLPVSVSGWGVRETVAAAFASSAGLTAEAAIAVSVTYGLIVLVSSVPGLFVVLSGRIAESPDTSATTGR